jgi:transketolase
MRKEFADFLLEEMRENEKIVVITADIGYGILDKIRQEFPHRVHNVGAAESLMIGVAVGYCYEGFLPVCYTITTFLLYRPFEMIRNYVNHEALDIKLVGSGRDRDYAHDEFTHWAEDDVTVVSNCFPNIRIFKPDTLTKELMHVMLYRKGPAYLNLKRSNVI